MTQVAVPRHAFLFEQLSLLSEAARARATGFEQRKLLRNRLRKENEERTIAAEILFRRSRGDSFGAIARVLNSQGWKGRNGSRWYAASVRNYFFKARGHADA